MKALAPFLIALSTLSILPVPFPRGITVTGSMLSRSAACYPLIGFLFGGIVYAIARLGSALAVPPLMLALLMLATPYILTKFLHFDGLADVLDGFFADRTPAERLIIMKDSRIGSFALGAGTLILLAKFIVLLLLLPHVRFFPCLIALYALSRSAVVILMAASRYPRASGTGKPYIGKLSAGIVVTAAASLFAGAIPLTLHLRSAAIPILIAAAIVTAFIMRAWSYRKIGGVTGDVLGATIEITELVLPAVLIVLARFHLA